MLVAGVLTVSAASINRLTTKAQVITNIDLLNIMTCNVRSLKHDKCLIELQNVLKDISWNIIGLAKERNVGEQTETRKLYISEKLAEHGE